MNRHRCETCDNFSKVKRKISTGRKCPSCNFNLEQEIELPACKGEPIGSHITQASIDCGLVCHSDFQSERDKLDELGMYLDGELERASQFNAMRTFALLEVKRKIKELWQKEGEH